MAQIGRLLLVGRVRPTRLEAKSLVMMVAMTLPSPAPRPWRYRRAVGATGAARLARLTVLVGVADFSVWTRSEWPRFRRRRPVDSGPRDQPHRVLPR